MSDRASGENFNELAVISAQFLLASAVEGLSVSFSVAFIDDDALVALALQELHQHLFEVAAGLFFDLLLETGVHGLDLSQFRVGARANDVDEAAFVSTSACC